MEIEDEALSTEEDTIEEEGKIKFEESKLHNPQHDSRRL
jgi:hypothetical protein